MATTTNYGWTTPDDTSLVKDGASAIRTLGTSVDTTTKNLNPETTLGDLAFRSSTSNVNTRLGIGTAGQVLTVASGVPSWATASSGSMTLISTTTFSATTSVTLSSIPSTYKDLKLVIRNLKPSTNLQYVYMRFNGDTSASYTSSNGNNAYGLDQLSAFGATELIFASSNNSTTAQGLTVIDIPDYLNTTTWKIGYFRSIGNDSTPTSGQYSNGIIAYDDLAAINSITFFRPSGNITSGTVLLYGVN